jgi:hypothetical protein
LGVATALAGGWTAHWRRSLATAAHTRKTKCRAIETLDATQAARDGVDAASTHAGCVATTRARPATGWATARAAADARATAHSSATDAANAYATCATSTHATDAHATDATDRSGAAAAHPRIQIENVFVFEGRTTAGQQRHGRRHGECSRTQVHAAAFALHARSIHSVDY